MAICKTLGILEWELQKCPILVLLEQCLYCPVQREVAGSIIINENVAQAVKDIDRSSTTTLSTPLAVRVGLSTNAVFEPTSIA